MIPSPREAGLIAITRTSGQSVVITEATRLRSLEMWGDVVSIGMRSTQILTRNNRMVIVPKSEIGEEQIVNYTYPDPTYREPSEISVAFDNDVKMVSQLLMETVRGVDGVMAEREIEVKLIPDNY